MDQPEWRKARLRSPWRSTLLVLSTTGLSILILLSIVNSFLTRQRDPVGCGMVWMRPIYAKYEGFDSEWTRFASKYGLYLYREGGINEDFQVKGIPVLFITGNAGSYKQARSIAAEAASYWANHISHDPERHNKGLRDLDFFTADFNEDITAFHGQTMLDQAEYLNDAIAYILSLYHDPQNPRREPGQPDPASVIVIGHSMGGIVARTMLTLPNYQAGSINTIITLSSPHARAPVSFDEDIIMTYKKINDYWRRLYSDAAGNDNPLSEVTMVSIVGGSLDTVVPSDYASLTSLVPESNGFTVFTSTMPRVWTGCDHLSILWCDQLRKAIVRALFQIVDVRKSSQTIAMAERMKIFRKQFLTGIEDHLDRGSLQNDHITNTTLSFNAEDVLPKGQNLWLLELLGNEQDKIYLVPIPAINEPTAKKKLTLLSNQSPNDAGLIPDLDILACNTNLSPHGAQTLQDTDTGPDALEVSSLTCKSIASDVIRLPSSTESDVYPFTTTNSFSYFQYSWDEVSKYQYIAIVDRSRSSRSPSSWMLAEFSGRSNSEIIHQVSLWELLFSGLHFKLPADRPVMVDIKVPAIYSSLLTYKLRIGEQSCGHRTLFGPMVRQYIQEPYESKYFVNVREADINLHGLSPYMPPPLRSVASDNMLSLQIWSDPSCETPLEVSLDPDIMGSFGKLVMRYRTMYPAIPLVIIALVLRKQFSIYDKSGVFITFLDSLDICMKSSIPVLLVSVIISSVLLKGLIFSTNLLPQSSNATELAVDFTKNDLLLGSPDAIFWLLLPIAGVLAIGACVLINYAALLLVYIVYSLCSITLVLARKLQRNHHRSNTENVFSSIPIRRRLVTTLVLFILILTAVPYQFAYMVACIVQLVTCTKALRAAREVSSALTNNFNNYSHSIFVLMLWVLPINLPVFVVWIHNLAVHWLTPFSSHHNILSIMPFVVLVESLSGGTMMPRITTRFRHITSILFFILAIYAGLYGVSYAYQLHDIANIIAAWLVIVQISSSGLSMSQLNNMLQQGDSLSSEQHVKKRP